MCASSYILKTSNKFELFMEMRDQSDWQLIRKKMMERGHLPEAVAAAAATAAAGGYGGGSHERSSNSKSSSSSSSSSSLSGSASSAEKERERSELLERLFRDRQAWRLMMKGVGSGKAASSPAGGSGSSGKGSASNMSLEDRMRENNQKSMLLQHAESLLTRNEDIFLLAAQRRRAWTGNSYLISMDREGGAKGGEGGSREFIGRLKSNFGGTEFVMYDYGVKAGKRSGKKSDKGGEGGGNGSVTPLNAGSAAGSAGSAVKYLRECGVIQYDHFFEHTGSPIRIKILLPNRSFYPLDCSAISGGIIRQYKAEAKDGNAASAAVSAGTAQAGAAGGGSANVSSNVALVDDLDDDEANHGAASAAPLPSAPSTPSSSSSSSGPGPAVRSRLPHHDVDEYEYQTPHQHIEVFENLRPVWHDGMNAYVLHFDNHRVREKSVKNFKLVRNNDDGKKTVLQFGRVMDRNVFVMDFAWPLSAFQAFAICLSSIDPKIAV